MGIAVGDISELEFHIRYSRGFFTHIFVLARDGSGYRMLDDRSDESPLGGKLPAEEGDRFLATVIERADPGTWEREYTPSYSMLDGWGWSLTISDHDGKLLVGSHGSNAAPSGGRFEALLEAIRTIRPGFADDIDIDG